MCHIISWPTIQKKIFPISPNFCKISHFYTAAQNMIIFIKISFSNKAILLMIKINPLYTLILICNWLFCPLKTFSLWSFIFWSQKRCIRIFLTSKNLSIKSSISAHSKPHTMPHTMPCIMPCTMPQMLLRCFIYNTV